MSTSEPDLTIDEIRAIRQQSQLLAEPTELSVTEITSWFGAMQAQDLGSAKWSYGARLPGTSEAQVDEAIESGSILRTWPMRGTIHFVPSEDVIWMLELMASRQLRSTPRRQERFGLTDAEVARGIDAAQAALAGGKRLTRSALIQVFSDAGIDVSGQCGYYLLWFMAHSKLTCIGPSEGKEQTFALISDWAGKQRELSRDEALREIAIRYFRSHGPAPHQDLMGWTTLPGSDVKKAIALAGDELTSASYKGRDLWMAAGARDSRLPAKAAKLVHALPGFDEFVLGYKDRTHFIADGGFDRVVPGGNGMFRSTIVSGGEVIGIWTRTQRAKSVKVTAEPFRRLTATETKHFTAAIAAYGDYLGKPAELTISAPEAPGLQS